MDFSDLQKIEGLQFMPVLADKKPIEKGWQKNRAKYNLKNREAVGLVCGALSGGVEVIDVDLKYDLTGTLFQRYKTLVQSMNPDLLKKLVVQGTRSKGFHLIYRCKKIEGNLKLANRATTDEEKRATFLATLKHEVKEANKKGIEEAEATPKARIIAEKAAQNDKVRVLFETRGEGGYIACFPTPGYDLVFGDFYSIQEITEDERETLLNIARQFNSYIEEFRPVTSHTKKVQKGLSAFEAYNESGDVVSLLEQHGWRIVGQKGVKTVFLRPGQTSSASSGNYDHDKKWFSVFTTSTEFDPQTAYLPYAVYAILECNKDFKAASEKLYEAGYGDRREVVQQVNQKTPSKVSLIDNDLSFLENPDDFKPYLQMARDGTLPQGLPTGIKSLDEHFLFKRGDLVMINGVDNVGKTIIILFLMLLAALHHGWNFLIFSCENTNKSLYKRLIEFYFGKKINTMNDMEFAAAESFIRNHFTFIKSEEELYNYKDIVNMAKLAYGKKKFDGALIDPYNGLKIELTNSSKLNTHEYHYEAISEIKQFGTKYDISWFINNHAVTSALRSKDDTGFQKAPGKEDTEGGGKFSNKAAQFITIHRLTQHPTEWMVTELHIRKVKETETGGHVTPKASPVKIALNPSGCGFCEVVSIPMGEKPILGLDPIQEFHKKNKPKQSEMYSDSEVSGKYAPIFNDTIDSDNLPF